MVLFCSFVSNRVPIQPFIGSQSHLAKNPGWKEHRESMWVWYWVIKMKSGTGCVYPMPICKIYVFLVLFLGKMTIGSSNWLGSNFHNSLTLNNLNSYRKYPGKIPSEQLTLILGLEPALPDMFIPPYSKKNFILSFHQAMR